MSETRKVNVTRKVYLSEKLINKETLAIVGDTVSQRCGKQIEKEREREERGVAPTK